jgi:hypothetical protein
MRAKGTKTRKDSRGCRVDIRHATSSKNMKLAYEKDRARETIERP